MKLAAPRIAPLPDQATDPAADSPTPAAAVPNVFRTLAHHPKLLKRWLVFGNHILFKNALPARDRELLILRTGFVCDAEYEWAQHVVIGRRVGLTEVEIARIAEGPEADGWSEFDRVQLRAVDELRTDSFIADETWRALSQRYNAHQMMDLVFTVGQYTLVSMALNTFGVQLDDGLSGFPEGTRS